WAVPFSAGGAHTCGLTSDGVAYCWGSDLYGQIGDGGTSQDSKSPVAVDVSGITGATTFVQLAAGEHHTCGLTSDGVAYCWGSDGSGRLGDGGTSQNSQSPVAVDVSGIAGATSFVQLAAGQAHTCGLSSAGVAYCWGSDGSGRLGDGGTSQSSQSPVAVDVSGITG